jgi:hypothetical protein
MLILNLVDSAAQAAWSDGYVNLPWAGDAGAASVRHAENVALEDGQVAPRVIEVSPRRPVGRVIGRFPAVSIPAEGAQVRSGVGFRQGGGGGAAYFSVIAEFADAADAVPLRHEYHKPESNYVGECHFDLARFAGMTGTIGLMVEGASPGANPVWLNTQLISLVDEYPFAEYVGAAVGSAMDGETLLNAWGGKSGVLFGEIWIVLEFRNVDLSYSLQLWSEFEGADRGLVELGVSPGQTRVATALTRTERGRWTERVIFNGGRVADVRYTVNDVGE